MKRRELIEMMDEGVFLTKLAEAKIPDEDKISILKERQAWKLNRFRQGKPARNKIMTVKGRKVRVGEHFIDPLTGRLRINVGS